MTGIMYASGRRSTITPAEEADDALPSGGHRRTSRADPGCGVTNVPANGFDGVSVAAVMKAAGLTHGGFYAHFDSKDALAAASVERALSETRSFADQAGEAAQPLAAFVAGYLSSEHRDDPAQGCTMAALAKLRSTRSISEWK